MTYQYTKKCFVTGCMANHDLIFNGSPICIYHKGEIEKQRSNGHGK